MFLYDERFRGLPAKAEQVVALYQSINTPHVAIPGKQAGPAQAFIVALRGQNGFAVFIYLFLAEGPDCAVYASNERSLSVAELPGEETEALGFVESMGFIMDNLNYRTLPGTDQEGLLKQLPVFRRDPKLMPVSSPTPAAKGKAQAQAAAGPSQGTLAALARFFSSF